MEHFKLNVVFMNKNSLIVFLVAVLFFSSCTKREKLPNIILIFTDDQGYADVGVFGAKDFSTPNIDKLAEEGMRFTNFYVSEAVCSASRASLMTGCYAKRVSIFGALMPWTTYGLNPEEVTVADMLRQKGYTTGMVGKWHLGHDKEFLPLQNGFDEYLGLPYSNDMWSVDCDGKPVGPKSEKPWKAQYPPLILIDGNKNVDTIATLADQATLTTKYTERAIRFIDKNKDRPFFLYFAHSMPHVPLGVSDKYKGKSKQGMYGDVIEEIDWSVGQIVETLKRLKIEDNTLIIYTSDNGPWLNFGNHAGSAYPLREGKGTAFEGGVREPTVMKWPGHIPGGKVCDKMASTIDILPTLAEITGAGIPGKPIDGVSILPLMKGKQDTTPRDEFFYYYNGELRAIRKDKWKLFFPHNSRSYEGMKPGKDGCPGKTKILKVGLELYDLENDPGERNNLASQHPDIVENLSIIAGRMRKKLGDKLTGIKGREVRPPGRKNTERTKKINHLAIGKKVIFGNSYNQKYTAGGDSALNDGLRGSLDFNDGKWQSYRDEDPDFIIDLGKETDIEEITCSFLNNQRAWIFLPVKVDFMISADGKKFNELKHFEQPAERDYKQYVKEFTFKSGPVKTRYVRVIANSIDSLPQWHPGAGKKAWVFVDEIVIK